MPWSPRPQLLVSSPKRESESLISLVDTSIPNRARQRAGRKMMGPGADGQCSGNQERIFSPAACEFLDQTRGAR